MKSSSLRRLLFPLLAFAVFDLSAADTPAEAAPKSPVASARNSDAPLVVTGGVFTGKDGKRTSATIRNLVDLISERYPETNITIVGVENVVIENLTLQWRRTRQPAPEGEIARRAYPPLQSVLMALTEASGRKFLVRDFGPNDFVLAPETSAPSPKTTEVFNLIAITGRVSSVADIDEEIAQQESRLKSYAGNHPQKARMLERIDQLKKDRLKADKGEPVPTALMEKIRDVVSTALQSKSPDQLPEFKYHPGSKLLIVTGSPEAIDLTRKVIAALEKEP